MKKIKLIKVIASSLVLASMLTVNSIRASAGFKWLVEYRRKFMVSRVERD